MAAPLMQRGVPAVSRSRLYRVWVNMKLRCYSPTCGGYVDYGARGIRVCDEWLADSANFLRWALANGYTDELQIERIDNDGNYEPANCRWATRYEQAHNKRDNLFVVHDGRKWFSSDLSALLGLTANAARTRIRRWKDTPERIFNTPAHPRPSLRKPRAWRHAK